MRLERVEILNLRCIETAELRPGAGVNWIVGGNGAGKTSVLEGLYMLARGRSFRGGSLGSVIRRGEKSIVLLGKGISDKGEPYVVGIERWAEGCRAKVNGEGINRISDLARGLPLQVVVASSYQILDRGPSFRRRLLDWGVFHVEHSYRSWYADYDRCLRQRNAAIRSRDPQFWIWDQELVRLGQRIAAWRGKFCSAFEERFRVLAKVTEYVGNVQFRYKAGWEEGADLAECLMRVRASDFRRGYSTVGAQKADMEILWDGRPVVEVLSRGEQKLLMVVMHLALGQTIADYTGERSLMLVDDLPAELDDSRRSGLLSLLKGSAVQCFVSTVHERYIDGGLGPGDRVFHVEHGRVLHRQ